MKQLKILSLFLGILCTFSLVATSCQETIFTNMPPISPTPQSPTGNLETDTKGQTATPEVTPSQTQTQEFTQSSSTTGTIETHTPTSTNATHIPLTPTAIPEYIDPSKPMIALTFDDGPTVSVTNRILDVLEQYNAKATFFVVGNRLGSTGCQNTVARAYSLGCEIASHTYSHPKLSALTVTEIECEISKTNDALISIIGVPASLVRPPYGSINDTVRATVKAPFILWSVDPEDWNHRDATKTYNNVISVVKDGDIVLMHDLYSSTAEACEKLIPQLLAQGYQLVTVSELFACKGITLTTGTAYRKTY